MPKKSVETLGDMGLGESIEDSFKAVYAEVSARDSGDGDVEEAAKTQTQDGGDTDADADDDTDAGKAKGRDGKGRFAKKAGDDEDAGDDDASDEDGDQSTAKAKGKAAGGKQKGVATEERYDPAPEWTADEQIAFRSLPPQAQKFVLDRVNAVTSRLSEVEGFAQQYQGLEQIIGPRREAWLRDGLTQEGVVRQLFALSDYANQRPAEFIQWFAKGRNIDLAKFAPQPSGADGDPFSDDPLVKRLNTEIGALKGQLAQLAEATNQTKSAWEQRQQQEQQQFQHTVNSSITSFRHARDESGALKYPYFDQVKKHMGALMTGGLARDMDEAYNSACRAHPDVAAKIESSRKDKEARDQAARQREKAAAAKKTGSSVSGQPGARSEPAFTGDVRDDLRQSFAEAGLV